MRDHDAARQVVGSLVARYSGNAVIRDMRLLASSTQAKVFVVKLVGRPEPVIAKLFRQQRLGVAAALDDEFESLALMARAFRDVEIDGWRVTAPTPVLRSFTPPALLMTAVPGVPLDQIIQTQTFSERRDLARLVCGALVVYWSSAGRIIADVTLSNILADAEGKQLAFVDPGLPEPAFSCADIASDFAPGSRDLAFLLVHVLATNVRIGLLAKKRARVRAAFAVAVVRHYAAEYLTSDQTSAFFAEVHGCATRHVARIPVGGPREPWRRHVREQVKHQLAVAIDELARAAS